MRSRAPIALASFVCLFAFAAAGEPTPTPAPRPKPTRKLGGGSFGVPPAPTPAAKSGKDGSLAGVVRQTQDQVAPQGPKRSKGVVISNETLRKGEPTPTGRSITIVGRPGEKPFVKAPQTPVPVPTPLEYRDSSGRTEADWRARAAAVRGAAEEAEAKLTAAQAEVRRLENDFYAWSDGNYREHVIRPAWDQAKERLKSLEEAAVKARAAMNDLEEDARKSGAPPGWLR